jgi:hypothetical protein
MTTRITFNDSKNVFQPLALIDVVALFNEGREYSIQSTITIDNPKFTMQNLYPNLSRSQVVVVETQNPNKKLRRGYGIGSNLKGWSQYSLYRQ